MVLQNADGVLMSLDSHTDILRRKTARSGLLEDRSMRDFARHLRFQLSKILKVEFNINLKTKTSSLRVLERDTFAQAMQGIGLIGRLDVDEATAGIGLCSNFAKSLVAVQTSGQFSVQGNAAGEVVTLTEAALIAPYIDQILRSLDDLNLPEGMAYISKFRFGSQMRDGFDLANAFATNTCLEIFYEFECNALGPFAFLLLLPLPDVDTGADVLSDHDQKILKDEITALEVELRAILARRKIAFSELAALKVGDVLEFPQAILFDVDVVSAENKTEFSAQLGRVGEQRALRVDIPPNDEDFTPDPNQVTTPSFEQVAGSADDTPPLETKAIGLHVDGRGEAGPTREINTDDEMIDLDELLERLED